MLYACSALLRSLRYPWYKAHRPEDPPELKQHVAAVLSVVEALGIPILTVPGVEADDVIATLATRAAKEGLDAIIVSPDKVWWDRIGRGYCAR
jgi:DNA polymerase-1